MAHKSDTDDCCSNPFGLHNDQVRVWELKAISESDKRDHPDDPAVVVGKLWCRKCRTTQSQTRRFSLASTQSQTKRFSLAPSGSHRRSANSLTRNELSAAKSQSTDEGPFCCDPHELHPDKKISKVRPISEANLAQFPSLHIGTFWCDRCRKYKAILGGVRPKTHGAPQDKETASASGLRREAGQSTSSDHEMLTSPSTAKNSPDVEKHPSESETQSTERYHQAEGADSRQQSVEVHPCDDVHRRCSYRDRHKRPITKNLREIKQKDLEKFTSLKVGDFLCTPCYYTREPEPATIESREPQGTDATTSTENNDSEMRMPIGVSSENTVIRSNEAEISNQQQEEEASQVNTESSAMRVFDAEDTGGGFTMQLSMNPDVCHVPLLDTIENSKCLFYRDELQCNENLRVISSLNSDEMYAMSWNGGIWEFNSHSFICENHYFEYVGKYYKEDVPDPTVMKFCCDPFKSHFKRIKNNLRSVSFRHVVEGNAYGVKLTLGAPLCQNCVTKITSFKEEPDHVKTPVLSRQASSSGSSSLTPSIPKVSASLTLTTMGLSPISAKSRSETGRILYGRKKLNESLQVIQTKISRALNVPGESIEPIEFKKARFHDQLMEDVKKKLPGASKQEKYQLISLIPSEMTPTEACNEFHISRTLFQAVQVAKKLSGGILPSINFTRRSTVPDSTKAMIENYFTHDDNSRQLPDKRANIKISKTEFVQKRILLCSLNELYQNFVKTYPDLKVSFSVFYKSKPIWCVYPGGPGTRNVCVCQYHEDMKLVLSALGITISYREIIKALVCDVENRTCMLRLCNECPSVNKIVQYLENLVKEDLCDFEEDCFMAEMIEFNQWKSTDRTELITQICSRSDLLRKAGEQFHVLIPHHFIAKQQILYVNKTKEALTPKKVLVNFDFALNFGCLYVNEVQSYHWGKTQVTLHIGVIFYKDKADQDSAVKYYNVCMVSDDLKHDVAHVKICMNKIVEIIKELCPDVEEVEYLTDGCAHQYKNKVSFLNLCHHFEEYGLKASHTFYATSHGKSQCDALAGVIKKVLTLASLKRVKKDHINSARKAYDFLISSELTKKIKFVFVDKDKTEVERQRISALNPKKTMKAVPGTRSFHHYVPVSENSIGCKRLSEDEQLALVHTIRQIDVQEPDVEYSAGEYVCAKIERKHFVAQITDVNLEFAEAEVTILTPKLPADVFEWPEDLNTMFVPIPHLVCALQLTEIDAGYYSLTQDDRNLLIEKKILKKKK